jgi:hypothetical protein
MKIAIFADSYGDPDMFPKHPDREILDSVGLSWTELLSQEFEITNFSKSGSSVYYSYKLFYENHAKFDKIIFIPSIAGRFSVFLPDRNEQIQCVPNFGLPPVENEHYFRDKQVLSAAKEYIIHILDLEKERVFNQLMIAQVKRIRPDVFLIPAFQETGLGPYLNVISSLEDKYWKINNQFIRKNNLAEIRKCHFSKENNHMIFEKIKDLLNGVSSKFTLDANDFRIPAHSWKHYFVNIPELAPPPPPRQ